MRMRGLQNAPAGRAGAVNAAFNVAPDAKSMGLFQLISSRTRPEPDVSSLHVRDEEMQQKGKLEETFISGFSRFVSWGPFCARAQLAPGRFAVYL